VASQRGSAAAGGCEGVARLGSSARAACRHCLSTCTSSVSHSCPRGFGCAWITGSSTSGKRITRQTQRQHVNAAIGTFRRGLEPTCMLKRAWVGWQRAAGGGGGSVQQEVGVAACSRRWGWQRAAGGGGGSVQQEAGVAACSRRAAPSARESAAYYGPNVFRWQFVADFLNWRAVRGLTNVSISQP
jgi:hypothetical protein